MNLYAYTDRARSVAILWLTYAIWLVFLLLPWRIAFADQQNLDDFWETWRKPGVHAIMRHATAPGYGDPENFSLGNCETQRNLSDAGKDEARRTGALFRKQGPNPTFVYTSQWCRTMDTATLLNLGTPKALPALNSFFQGRGDGQAQTQALKEFLTKQDVQTKLFMVTHQVNISALTGSYSSSGEILLFTFKDGEVTIMAKAKLAH